MAITNNPDLAKLMRSLTNHGIDLTELPTGDSYDPTWLARKFRFNRIVGLAPVQQGHAITTR